MITRLLSWLLYPALVGGAVAGAWSAVRAGAPAALVLVTVQVVIVIAAASLERIMPEHVSWRRAKDDVKTDALYFVVSGVLVAGTLRALIFAYSPSLGVWPRGWPLLVQLVLALALADFGSFATHVVEHRTTWLWPIHAPHHSAKRLYWLNATRMHPLDQLLTVVLSLVPLATLGAPPELLVLFDAFAVSHLTLQHSNVRLRHGPLSHVLATAEFHRWHHSKLRGESECNYAAFLSIWDHLFGTFRMPRGEQAPEDVGLYDGATMPDDFGGQIRAPFRERLQ